LDASFICILRSFNLTLVATMEGNKIQSEHSIVLALSRIFFSAYLSAI